MSYREQVQLDDALESLHAELSRLGVIPGWHRPGRAPMWSEPRPSCTPCAWSFQAAKAALDRAGALVDPSFAERRNLILANRSSAAQYPTVATQVMAFQMILPGERARTHRHTPHAGRLIIEAGDETYTVVDGERIDMSPGDVLLTPSWSWHGHTNKGSSPAYWLDFLDVPLVQMLEPMFFQPYPGDWQEGSQAPDHTMRRRIFFPWSETRRRLEAAKVAGEIGVFGPEIQLDNAATPTLGLTMHELRPGDWSAELRTSANYQFCVVEGEGISRVNGESITWSRGDVLAIPCWTLQQHYSKSGAVLFGVSDEPLQKYCGYLHTSLDTLPEEGEKSGGKLK